MRPVGVAVTAQLATAAHAADPIAHVKPVLGSVAGYEFELGPMIAGLIMCFAVRLYVSFTDAEHRWSVDASVTLIALAFTAAIIQQTRPIPLVALIWGTGLGALGVGIIRMALSFVKKNLPFADDDGGAPKP